MCPVSVIYRPYDGTLMYTRVATSFDTLSVVWSNKSIRPDCEYVKYYKRTIRQPSEYKLHVLALELPQLSK